MSDLQEPLTPADCDLTGFKFMPLEVARLRRSKQWLIAKRKPEIGFYAINLWAASWHELPAASLEDDDDTLADFSMCPPERWPSVRDDVLRGWIKCSDGRLYHPVVAEKALEAWAKRSTQRANARKRWGNATAMPRHIDGNPKSGGKCHGIPTAMQGTETETETKNKTPSESAGFENPAEGDEPLFSKRVNALASKPKRSTGCEAFDSAWAAWPQKGRSSKTKSLALWQKHGAPEADKLAAVRRFLDSRDGRKEGGAFVPGLEIWIRDRLDSWIELAPRPADTAPISLPSLPPMWAKAAAIIAKAEPAAWRSYGAACSASESDGELHVTAAAFTAYERLNRIVESLEPKFGFPVFVHAPERGASR